MEKKYLYIGIGVGVCLVILGLSLGLYFGLRDKNDDGNSNPVTTTTTTTRTTTTTTQEPVSQGPIENNGTQRTPLDDFVYSQESMDQFSWFRADSFDFEGTNVVTNISYRAYVLNMTSGYWQTGNISIDRCIVDIFSHMYFKSFIEEEVGERHLWWHVIVVVIPDNLRTDYQSQGYIYVSKNDNSRNDGTGMPNGNDDETVIESSTIATGVGMPIAICYQVQTQQHLLTLLFPNNVTLF